MTVLIKRYANRKLYNTETSRYITLKGIAVLDELGDALQGDVATRLGVVELSIRVALDEGRHGVPVALRTLAHESGPR